MQSLKLVSHYHLCKANVTAVQSYRKKESLGPTSQQKRPQCCCSEVRPATYQTAHFLAGTNPRAELK